MAQLELAGRFILAAVCDCSDNRRGELPSGEERMKRLQWAALGLALPVMLLTTSITSAQSVLRVVPQADLKIIDPFFTTANITSNHGYMVYDVLFALDAGLKPQPEMIESYAVSADNLVWSFKLRPGLKFSDGSPVEAKDAVASLKRWRRGSRPGRPMMRFTEGVAATGPGSFRDSPQAAVRPDAGGAGLAREPTLRHAREGGARRPNAQITEVVGSGPSSSSRRSGSPATRWSIARARATSRARSRRAALPAQGGQGRPRRVALHPEAASATQALATARST